MNGHSPARDARSRLVAVLTSRPAVAVASILLTLIFTSFRSIADLSGQQRSRIPRRLAEGAPDIARDLTTIQATAAGPSAGEKLLILTPLKDASPWLDEYFENLARLTYPPNLISLAFLVSDTTDDTIAKLERRARRLAKLPKAQRYDSITILQKDFHFNLGSEVRHGFEGQPVRRSFIAKARNWLLTAALRWDHAWVLWLDVDVVRYDPNILSDLMSIDKDIVVPNTLCVALLFLRLALYHARTDWDCCSSIHVKPTGKRYRCFSIASRCLCSTCRWHLEQSWDFWVSRTRSRNNACALTRDRVNRCYAGMLC